MQYNISKTQKFKESETFSGIALAFPMLSGFILFTLVPVVFSLMLSFTSWNFISGLKNIKFNGINNYIELFGDLWFKDSLKNTILFTIGVVTLDIVFGLFFAVILDKAVYGTDIFKAMFFIPYISSMVALAVLFTVILHPSFGPVNEFLRLLGINNPPRWFGDMYWAMPTLILFTFWRDLGYYIIIFTAGLKGISNELYEAASIDGAGIWQKFRNITLPMISPTTFFLMVTGIIGSFKVFDQISVTTEGGPGTSTTVLVYYIYKSAFQHYRMGYASSIAWILFVLIFIITLLQWKYQKKWVNYD